MKKMMAFVLSAMLLSGCSAKYNAAEVTKSTELMVRNKTVVIAQPEMVFTKLRCIPVLVGRRHRQFSPLFLAIQTTPPLYSLVLRLNA